MEGDHSSRCRWMVVPGPSGAEFLPPCLFPLVHGSPRRVGNPTVLTQLVLKPLWFQSLHFYSYHREDARNSSPDAWWTNPRATFSLMSCFLNSRIRKSLASGLILRVCPTPLHHFFLLTGPVLGKTLFCNASPSSSPLWGHHMAYYPSTGRNVPALGLAASSPCPSSVTEFAPRYIENSYSRLTAA